MGQNQTAALLELSRPSVTSGLRELILARLVTKQRNGVYRINAMLAAYETPADARAAIDAMDPADRLDDPHFVARYHQAVESKKSGRTLGQAGLANLVHTVPSAGNPQATVPHSGAPATVSWQQSYRTAS